MLDKAEVNMTFQVMGVNRSKFSPNEELKIIEAVMDKLNDEGVEIADSNSNVEININELAGRFEKEMLCMKPMSRIW